MRELLAITDVTYMWEDVVCIAGVTQDFRCIRPVTDGGVRIWTLYKSKRPIIYPGSKVWMGFSEAEINPPHIEDRTFDPMSVQDKDAFSQRHWETLLRKISYGSVQDVFDGNLRERRVHPGTDTRSLGTIKNVDVQNITAERRYDRPTLRMDFEDESGDLHQRFPVNDLAFRGLFGELADQHTWEQRAAEILLDLIKDADRVYLRVGLARPTEIGDYEKACWVQVTGVYTFPDYLNGRTWADFV